MAIALAVTAPVAALANDGILLLTHNGPPEWNASVKALVAKVDAQKPADVVFGLPTSSSVAPAVDRLARRGITDVIAIPFFLTTPIAPEHLGGHALPVRIAPAAATDPVFAGLVLSRVEAISRNPKDEVLVLVGYGADDAGTPWRVDLGPTAQRLKGMRQFATILSVAKPDNPTDREKQQIRLTLERNTAAGRRILVVPVLQGENGSNPMIERLLEGLSYDVAPGGIISDDRVAQAIAASALSP
jgi:sirohydrochlorin ferrochelatase